MIKKDRKKLEKKLEELWKQAVKKKWGNWCSICSSSANLHVHHFVHRSKSNNLRYDVENGVVLCARDHLSLHNGQEAIMAVLIARKRGDKWWKYIEKQKNIFIRKNLGWYEDTLNNLQTK